jgi:hypothetical protein
MQNLLKLHMLQQFVEAAVQLSACMQKELTIPQDMTVP